MKKETAKLLLCIGNGLTTVVILFIISSLSAQAQEVTNQVITGAKVIDLRVNQRHQIQYKPGWGQSFINATPGNQLREPGSQLTVLAQTAATNFATLVGLSEVDDYIGPGLMIEAGSTTAEYLLPCGLGLDSNASTLVLWQERPHSGVEPGCVPPGVEVTMLGQDEGITSQPGSELFAFSTYSLNSKSSLQTQAFPISLDEMIGFEYCSAIAGTGDHWSIASSPILKLPFGITSSSNPCQQAKEQCEEDSSGSCFVANWEEWSLDETELTVSLDCVDDWNWRDPSIEAALVLGLIPQIQDIAKTAGATGCVFNIYTPGEIVIEPDTDDVVLAQVRNFENRALAVDALAGDILVKSSLEPDGVLVEEGNTYALVDSTLINQEEGTNQGYISIPPAPTPREVFNAPLLQELVEEQLPNNQDTEQLAEIVSQEFQNTINELMQEQEQQEGPF